MQKSEKNKSVPDFMFYIVNYRGDTDKKYCIVPSNWIFEKKKDMPYTTYVYYNPNTISIKVLPLSFLYQVTSEDFNNKKSGNAYKASVISGFGKSKIYKKKMYFKFAW